MLVCVAVASGVFNAGTELEQRLAALGPGDPKAAAESARVQRERARVAALLAAGWTLESVAAAVGGVYGMAGAEKAQAAIFYNFAGKNGAP